MELQSEIAENKVQDMMDWFVGLEAQDQQNFV